MKTHGLLAATLTILVLSVGTSDGVPIAWTDWTAADSSSAVGTVDGIDIKYEGTLSFSQLGSGANYWTEGTPAPYTGNAVVDNAPTPSEMLGLNNASSHQIAFSSPVQDPIMAIVSQGQPRLPVTYAFDTPFTVLSEGRGYWGDGTYQHTGNDLIGYEFHGVIQFQGTVSSIGWASDPNEYWHGFTMGLPTQSNPVSDSGATIVLLTLALGSLRMSCKRLV